MCILGAISLHEKEKQGQSLNHLSSILGCTVTCRSDILHKLWSEEELEECKQALETILVIKRQDLRNLVCMPIVIGHYRRPFEHAIIPYCKGRAGI